MFLHEPPSSESCWLAQGWPSQIPVDGSPNCNASDSSSSADQPHITQATYGTVAPIIPRLGLPNRLLTSHADQLSWLHWRSLRTGQRSRREIYAACRSKDIKPFHISVIIRRHHTSIDSPLLTDGTKTNFHTPPPHPDHLSAISRPLSPLWDFLLSECRAANT